MNHSQYHGSNSLVYNNYHILHWLIKVVTEAYVYMYPTTSLVLCDSTTFPMLSCKFSLCHNQFDKNTHRYVFLSWTTGIQVRSRSFIYILVKYICMIIIDMQWNVPVPSIFIFPLSKTGYNMNSTSFNKTNINKTRPK